MATQGIQILVPHTKVLARPIQPTLKDSDFVPLLRVFQQKNSSYNCRNSLIRQTITFHVHTVDVRQIYLLCAIRARASSPQRAVLPLAKPRPSGVKYQDFSPAGFCLLLGFLHAHSLISAGFSVLLNDSLCTKCFIE